MMKITLQKDHMCPEGHFKAGEVIEVDKPTYDWLMSVYLAERAELTKTITEHEKKLDAMRKRK